MPSPGEGGPKGRMRVGEQLQIAENAKQNAAASPSSVCSASLRSQLPRRGSHWALPRQCAIRRNPITMFHPIVPQLPVNRIAGFVRFLSEICQTAERNSALLRTARKIFKKFSEISQHMQEKIKQTAHQIRRFVCAAQRNFLCPIKAEAEKIKQSRLQNRKKTNKSPQKRRNFPEAVCFGRKGS